MAFLVEGVGGSISLLAEAVAPASIGSKIDTT